MREKRRRKKRGRNEESEERVCHVSHSTLFSCLHFFRCGQGAVALARSAGLTIGEDVTLWDINETKGKGPFPEIATDYDILVNCIYLAPNPQNPVKPFVTNAELDVPSRRLSVIVDVSCDITNPSNPLPVYNSGTTFFDPTIRIREQEQVGERNRGRVGRRRSVQVFVVENEKKGRSCFAYFFSFCTPDYPCSGCCGH